MPITDANTANLQLVKEANLALVFDLVYRQGPISRTQLASRTHLSPTTVSSLIEELLRQRLVRETGAGKTLTSGRKPILIEINAAGAYILAFELVATGCRCILYNLICQEADSIEMTVADFRTLGVQMVGLARNLLARDQVAPERLAGIAVGVPGLIDSNRSQVISSTVVPLEADCKVTAELQAAFPNVPVLLENESNLCACAEKAFGSDRHIGNLVYLNINRGLGAGIILEGRLFRGSWGIAGEAGHMTIDRNGPRCPCGNRGCLEVMAGIPALVQLAALPILSGRPTLIKDLSGGDLNRISPAIIRQAFEMGDVLAAEILTEMAGRLACGINSIINLYNPQVVALGGEICQLGDPFLQLLHTSLAGVALQAGNNRTLIRYAAVREQAVLLGGARIVLDSVFRRPTLFAGR